MTERPSHYQAYLLRLWRDDDDAPWRVVLKDAHNNTVYTFVNLAAFYAFLEQQTGQPNTINKHSAT